MSRIRLTTALLLVWTALGATGAYWGYSSVMAECPPPEAFSGCFEPPYRFAAGVLFLLWGAVEALLVLAWLTPWIAALGRRAVVSRGRRSSE